MSLPGPEIQTRKLLTDLAGQAEADLSAALALPGVPETLARAMRYAVLGSGKRLRPALVHLSARAAAGSFGPAIDPSAAAVAIELIHCYSLVHDDLPAMDDDSLRRGRPTVHVKFGQAMAILVGDALLTEAFAVLARVKDPAVSAALTAELARAAGPAGMIAGQVADMGLCDVPAGQDGLEYIPLRKTAAMFEAAARMGALCARANQDQLARLGQFGLDLGLAFQIKDDLLDATSTSDELGKTAGKDAAAGKRTFPGELGLQQAQQALEAVSRRAMESLASFGSPAEPLRELAGLLIQREY